MNTHDGLNRRSIVHILLLEDSEIDAELLAAHLAKADMNFDVKRVVNRREFVRALEEGVYEIILADYSLPEFDGLSALNIARALQPEIPFIFVSGVVGEEFATNALKRGATDYVMKRNLSRLATAVERALDQARERRERQRAEEALRRSEASAKLAAEAAQLGLWDYDPRSGGLIWDERCKAMFGLGPSADVTYDLFLRGCHPDDRDRMHAAVMKATSWNPDCDGAFEEEFRTLGPDGQERWIATRGQAQFKDDVCVRFLGVVRDVTEERRAREALENLAVALEGQVAERTAERDRIWRLTPDLFAVIGFDARLRRVNPAWRAMLGYDPDELISSKLTLLLHPADQGIAAKEIAQLKGGARVGRFENRIRLADGGWRWISWTAAPETDALYVVGRDITSEKLASEELSERNRELAEQIEERERVEDALRQMQRLEAVGQLTSGVAHDFNNLLTVILGNIGFVERALAEAPSPPRALARIETMRAAAERGAKLTTQLLAFSRRQKLEPKPIDLNGTVAGMRDLLQSTMGGNIRIELVMKEGLWPALVDPTQIELIILNLAINARDAMEVGGALTLETTNVKVTKAPARPEEPAPGDYVVLAVSDTGPGMTPEVQAKAFEPFFTTKPVGKGSGLGLAQVYGFAKQSGGGVAIDSVLGEGASIKVYLPRAAHHQQVAERSESSAHRDVHCGVGHNILLVDDDSAVRDVTAAMLEDLGYFVVTAASGQAALDLLQTEQAVDLVLIDYAMPGMNGTEAARRAAQLRPELPVLFITGYADSKALRDIGEERIIHKPFDNQELMSKLGATLRPLNLDNVVRLRK